MKNKIILSSFLMLILLAVPVMSQRESYVFLLSFKYKDQPVSAFLNLTNISIISGTAANLQPVNGYRIDLIGNRKTIDSVKFSVPKGAAAFKGLTDNNAQQKDGYLNFQVKVPYYSSVDYLYIFDSNNNTLMRVSADRAVESSESVDVDIEGELEVIHADDFEHPENSKFFFYIRSGDQRYELKSSKELPLVLSGTLAHVTGKSVAGKIIVKEFNLVNKKEEQNTTHLAKEPFIKQGNVFSFKWIYFIPLLLVGLLLIYVGIIRRKSHMKLNYKRQQNSMGDLKNYIYNNLKKGYSKEQIKNALIKADYTRNEIENVFRQLK